jgi:hypothetical protein
MVVVTGHGFEEDELVDCDYESNFLRERLWFFLETGERGEKVNVKRENELCDNDYLSCFNLLSFHWFSKSTLLTLCNIKKPGCKVKKNNQNNAQNNLPFRIMT